ALQGDRWHRLDETTRYYGLELCHYGMAQRWLVVSSQAAMERAEARITKAQQREWEAIDKQLLHLHQYLRRLNGVDSMVNPPQCSHFGHHLINKIGIGRFRKQF